MCPTKTVWCVIRWEHRINVVINCSSLPSICVDVWSRLHSHNNHWRSSHVHSTSTIITNNLIALIVLVQFQCALRNKAIVSRISEVLQKHHTIAFKVDFNAAKLNARSLRLSRKTSRCPVPTKCQLQAVPKRYPHSSSATLETCGQKRHQEVGSKVQHMFCVCTNYQIYRSIARLFIRLLKTVILKYYVITFNVGHRFDSKMWPHISQCFPTQNIQRTIRKW